MLIITNTAYQIEEKRVLIIQTHVLHTMKSPELMKNSFKNMAIRCDDSADPDLYDYAITAWCPEGMHDLIICNRPLNIKRRGVGIYIRDSLSRKERADITTLP